MENVKINVDDYEPYGLGDLYYGLISFISDYVTKNYNPMEILTTGESEYAIAITVMKRTLKEILEILKRTNEIYLPSLNKTVNLNTLTVEEQLALEERCKECLILSLTDFFERTVQGSRASSGIKQHR